MNHLPFIKTTMLCGFLVLFGAGCLSTAPVKPEAVNQPVIENIDQEQRIKSYLNTKFNFSFSFPAEKTAWSELDLENEALIPASMEVSRVSIAENEGVMLFQAEVNTLTFEVIEGEFDLEQWVDQNSDQYTGGEETGRNNFKLDGMESIEINGGSNIASVYRLIVVQRGDHLLVISQGLANEEFNDIIDSIEFVK
ncbi:hypothetical protein ACFLZY_01860 [Patescibacteria group bacterium]